MVGPIAGGAAAAVAPTEPIRAPHLLAASSGRGGQALNLALRHAKRISTAHVLLRNVCINAIPANCDGRQSQRRQRPVGFDARWSRTVLGNYNYNQVLCTYGVHSVSTHAKAHSTKETDPNEVKAVRRILNGSLSSTVKESTISYSHQLCAFTTSCTLDIQRIRGCNVRD